MYETMCHEYCGGFWGNWNSLRDAWVVNGILNSVRIYHAKSKTGYTQTQQLHGPLSAFVG